MQKASVAEITPAKSVTKLLSGRQCEATGLAVARFAVGVVDVLAREAKRNNTEAKGGLEVAGHEWHIDGQLHRRLGHQLKHRHSGICQKHAEQDRGECE